MPAVLLGSFVLENPVKEVLNFGSLFYSQRGANAVTSASHKDNAGAASDMT